jgi:hypothetical protein
MPGGCGKICLDRWQTILGLERQNFWHNLAFSLKALLAYLALRQGGLLLHCAGMLAGGGLPLRRRGRQRQIHFGGTVTRQGGVERRLGRAAGLKG